MEQDNLPKAVEAEISALGSMILSKQAATSLSASLGPEMFYRAGHSRIFEACVSALRKDPQEMDVVLVKNEMAQDGQEFTPAHYEVLAEIIQATPNAMNYDSYAREVITAFSRRLQIQKLKSAVKAAMNGYNPERQLKLTNEVLDAIGLGLPKPPDVFQDAVEEARELREKGVDLSWGLNKLDTALGGMRRKHLYVVGAKTSHGKTAFAMNVIAHNLSHGKKVIYNGFENLDQVPKRLAAIRYQLPVEWFMKPDTCTDKQYEMMQTALEDIKTWKKNLLVLPGVSIAEMKKHADEIHPDIICLDYIQRYATSHIHTEDGALVYAIGRAISDVQDLSLQNNCAGLVLSQFSRRTNEMSSRAPEISDLKGSGEIENMADGIILLWWKYRDKPKTDPTEYTAIITKNKLGEIGELRLRINAETLTVTDH